jgi:hypothetical protein
MSDRDDDFLARWSRRKRAARSGEDHTPDEEAHAAPEAESDSQLPPAAAEPTEPLPSLNDLTADSDLAAFLRNGVPAALKNAAMRKMWSLDPTIRDYIGPSEYAWDFNRPGSMAGFGPLAAGKSVADFLSTVSRAIPAEKAATSSEAPPEATATASEHAGSPSAAEPVQPPCVPIDPPPPGNEVEVTAEPAEELGLAESSPASPRARHGGALPR